MFGFQKKEVFVTMDQEQYFRAVTALREQGIPFKTKLENGASMNVMGRGRTTAWGDTLRRLDTYYILCGQKGSGSGILYYTSGLTWNQK